MFDINDFLEMFFIFVDKNVRNRFFEEENILLVCKKFWYVGFIVEIDVLLLKEFWGSVLFREFLWEIFFFIF